MFCILFTQSIYYVRLPQPVGKDKNTFVHLFKKFPYPALDALPINPILFNAHILMLFILLLIHVQIRHQRNISAKIQKIFRKSDFMNGFYLQGELDLTLFYMIEGY